MRKRGSVRAVALDPELVDAYNNLGTALRAQGQEDAAENCYHRIVALRPDYPAAHYNLGLAQAKRGDLDAAVVSFRTALACPVADAPPERLADCPRFAGAGSARAGAM